VGAPASVDLDALKVRRRASRVRGIVRQLCGTGRVKAEELGEQVLADGQVLLRYRVEEIGFMRTAALSRLEAATLRFALARAGKGSVDSADRELVENALERLSQNLSLPEGLLAAPATRETQETSGLE
jgi:hypothetical protein